MPEKSTSKLLMGQVDDLYQNLTYANWSVILISSFLVWILASVTPLDKLLLWDAYILLIVLVREIMADRYFKATITEDNVNGWLTQYIAGLFLSGVGWGMILIFLVPPDQVIYQLTAIFLLGGLVTGSAATLASLKFGFAVFSIPAILPGAIYLIYLNGPVTFIIGCSLFLFLVFIFFVALRMHKTIFYSLKTQVEVGKKLSVLEVEKNELEIKLARLQDKLEFEQKEVEKLKAQLKHKPGSGSLVRRVNDLNDERFVALLESLEGGVWDMNVKSGEIVFSDGWLGMLGYDREESLNRVDFWERTLHPDDRQGVLNKLHAFAEGKMDEFSSSHRLKTRNGDWIWVMSRAHGVIWGSFGELLHLVGLEIYMPESGESVEKSLSLLNFDLKTWFSTNDNFDHRLEYLIKTASVDGIEHSVCQLKIIQMADQIRQDRSLEEIYLYEVGRVLLQDFRQGDAVIRVGNDSFVLLMEFCKVENAWEKGLALQKSLNDLRINFKGAKHRVAVAVGITPISNSLCSAREIMQNAEEACNLAITETSNLIQVYHRDDREFGANLFEKRVAAKIQDCIDKDAITISAKPLNTLTGEDDLAHIYTVEFGLSAGANENYTGADYRSIACKNNMIQVLDTYVIRHLLEWLKGMATLGAGNRDIYLYECSDASFRDPEFAAVVLGLLNQYASLSGSLCLGIPESLCTENQEKIYGFIHAVKASGCKVALTGVSGASLSVKMLKDCKVDFLKIGHDLMHEIESDQSSYITIKYINDIIHLAGMKSIVDDVDDESLVDVLRKIDIDYVQRRVHDNPSVLDIR